MPSTYVLISSTQLTSTTSSVTFSSIPSTYTDLVVKVSGRSTQTALAASVRFFINGNTGNVYSFTRLLGTGTGTSTYTSGTGNELYFNNGVSGASSTTNAFGTAEIYIPNYLSTTNKPMSSQQAQETNSSAANMGITATLTAITSAITSIEVATNPGESYVAGSSFYLYGIKNS